MHELSLMQEIVDLLRRSAEENSINRITKVNLVVGQMTAALPESLQFAFTALKKEAALLREAELYIEEKEITASCRRCLEQFNPDGPYFRCPNCGGVDVEVIGGRELYIESYEGDGDS